MLIDVADCHGTTSSWSDPMLVQSVPMLPWGFPFWFSQLMSVEPGLSDEH
jgi:hypothetical protein